MAWDTDRGRLIPATDLLGQSDQMQSLSLSDVSIGGWATRKEEVVSRADPTLNTERS